ncbi:MAG TPA: signal peptidase I [Nitrososphaeraceae archaeon]
MYSSSKYRIKLMYPTSWNVQEEVLGMVTFTTPSTSSIEFPDATFTIKGIIYTKGRPHFEDFSAKQFKDFMTQSFSLLNKYQISIPEIQLIDAVRSTTNTGYLSFRLQSTVKEADPVDPNIIYQQKRLQTWIPRGNNMYILEYDSGPSKFSTFLPLVEKMVNSFEIMNETENLGLYTPKPPNYHTLKEKLGRDNATIYVARSGSMEPYFYPDDMLLVSNSTAFNDVRIGDVIVFKKPADNSISIIARIIDIQTDSVGQRIITTKGDNNPSPILGTDFRIKKDNYIGKVISVITQVQK